MLAKIGRGLLTVLSIVVFFALYALFAGTRLELIPSYAVVFLDDANKTYVALPCVEDWQHKPTKTFDLLERSTAGEAMRRGYKMDDDCREAGGYYTEGRTLFGLWLEKIGVLSPKKFWWDRPYRTEEGIVVPPATKPQ